MGNKRHKRIVKLRKRNIVVSVVSVLVMAVIITIGVRLSENEDRAPGFAATIRVMGNDGTLPWVNKES